MSTPSTTSAAPVGDDRWALLRSVEDDLVRCAARLADPAATWTEADAEQVDALVMVIDDLRASAAPGASEDQRSPLSVLYEAPMLASPSFEALDELLERATLAQEQAWQRAGRPIPSLVAPRPILAPSVSAIPGIEIGAVGPGPVPDGPAPTAVMEVALDGPGPDPDAADTEPATDVQAAPRTDRSAVVVEVLTVIGVLMFVFVVYVVYGTGLAGAQQQELLERDFRADLVASVDLGQSNQESGMLDFSESAGDEAAVEAEADAVDAVDEPAIGPGDPVAVLSLPTIGSRSIVVEGTRADDLVDGTGHLRSTPQPGQAGNIVLFGRRTTYGGPFSDLDWLRPGDPMEVVTTQGAFRYVVQEVRRVGSGDPDPITTTFSNRLTLVTSDERYSSQGRLVAIGLLDGPPVATPTDAEGRIEPLPIVNPDELGTERTGVDWALTILWTQLLAGAYFGTRWLYAHWMPWSTWLVSAPVFLVVGFAWLDSLARLFPNTL